MLLNERRANPISSRFPGNGKPVYSDYNTITMSLAGTFAKERGDITFTANAADFAACDSIILDFLIKDKRTPSNMTKCPCDFSGTVEIRLPSPLPADIPTYVAENLRKHSVISSNMLQANAAGVVTYNMLQAGYEFSVTPRANSKGKMVTATQTIITASSTGNIPNIGAGAATWYHETITPNSPMRTTVGTVGWASAPAGNTPRFAGVLRSEDKFTDNTCDCTYIVDVCNTIFIHGHVQIPLELPLTAMPESPVVFGRHTSDSTVQNGKVGGYQILAAGTAAPAGMKLIPEMKVIDALQDKAIVFIS